jgi:uncharacterized protein YdeI (YjbR/CyaY-like superfamily)
VIPGNGMITNIDEYFEKGCGRCPRFATRDCSTRKWSAGLEELRRICLSVNLVETVKWGHPCYTHQERNIAIFGALRNEFRLSFFHAALLCDPQGVLEKPGPNSPHADLLRFTSNTQVLTLKPVIEAYLIEAIGYAESGLKPPKQVVDLEPPAELIEALASDPELASAFYRLTPGRQRSYVINLSSAKKPETRFSRIANFRDKILAGKGALER